MADTVTVNYGWTKPEIGASATTWGTKLNADLDLVDAQVFANQTAIGKLNGGAFTSGNLNLNKASVAALCGITGQSAGLARWQIVLGDATSETGSNAGSNFQIYASNDAGGYLSNPLSINRATGQVTVQSNPTTPASVATKQYVDAAGSFIGEIKMYAGVTPPTNWQFAWGQALSRTTYAALFAVIGTRFGAGDGSTTFNLPQLQERTPVGWDNTASGPYAMGTLGGEAAHTLTATEMPAHAHADAGHTHGVNDPGHAHTGVLRQTGSPNVGQVGATFAQASSTDPHATGITIAAGAANIQNAGGDGAHNNLPPYQVVGFIIRIQ